MQYRVWLLVLVVVTVGAVTTMPPALMLITGLAKLDLTSAGVVIVPTSHGGTFTLGSALILATLMFVGSDVLSWGAGNTNSRKRPTIRGCLIGLLTGAALFAMTYAVTSITHAPSQAQLYGLSNASTVRDKVLCIAALVVITPYAEEAFFRGAVEDTLTRALGPLLAIPVSALAFGLAHGIKLTLPLHFFAGLVLSALCYKRKSLYPAMLAHAMYNALTVVWSLKA